MKQKVRSSGVVKLLIVALILLSSISQAQAPYFDWAKRIGGSLNDQSTSVGTDAGGNVYTTGYFYATADFDPGVGVFNMIPAGGSDAFISKLDPLGNFVWAKQLSGTGDEISLDISIDLSGNIYTTGYFGGTVDFDPGLGVFNLTANGQNEIFVSKLDASGNFIWALQLGGTSVDDGYSIKTDQTGNVFITGDFSGTADFDPGIGFFNMTSTGLEDIFICKLNSAGSLVWAKQMGGSNSDLANSITIDISGSIYTSGYFKGTTDFDPSVGIFNLTSNGSNDIFVAKLDTSGNFVWAKQFGGASYDAASSTAVDTSGNSYTIGIFAGVVDFDPGPGIMNLTSVGGNDIFIAKLDAAGSFLWAKQLGGTGNDGGQSITTDVLGNVYSTGFFQGTADFDPGVGILNLTSAGASDIFISKLDMLGNFIWAKRMGGATSESGRSIYSNSRGDLFTVGAFTGTVDFDPGPGVNNLTSAGVNDFFVHKMSQCMTITNNQTITICSGLSIMVGNNIYNVTGVYSDTLTPLYGCDSIVVTNLTVNAAISNAQSVVLCAGQSVSVGNNSYNLTGTYTDTLTALGGCDSIITTSLTINPVIVVSQTVTVCSGQIFTVGMRTYNATGIYIDTLSAVSSCDSIVTTNLIVNSIILGPQTLILCAGQSISVGINIYNLTGIYLDTLIAIGGCDSIVTTNLTVNPIIIGAQTLTLCAGQSISVGINTYNLTGTYLDTLIAIDGCDSIVTTNLTVGSAIIVSQAPTICAGQSISVGANLYSITGIYVDTLSAANNCDSTVTTNLTVNPTITASQTITLCAGQSISVGNNSYNSTGVYIDTLLATTGCDSVVTTNLTVNAVDVTTTLSGMNIAANQAGASYQWIDCNNANLPMNGEVNQSLVIPSNGDYAVIVTIGGCSDTSVCVNISTFGMAINQLSAGNNIYPNPNKGEFILKMDDLLHGASIEIYTELGKKVFATKINEKQTRIDASNLSKGIYFVKVNNGKYIFNQKMVVQ